MMTETRGAKFRSIVLSNSFAVCILETRCNRRPKELLGNRKGAVAELPSLVGIQKQPFHFGGQFIGGDSDTIIRCAVFSHQDGGMVPSQQFLEHWQTAGENGFSI